LHNDIKILPPKKAKINTFHIGRLIQNFSGLTLYCTLEPCSFVGRTPACATTISQVGIRHVVIGIRDPHPKVNGAGLSIMRSAGVEVVEGLCVEEICESLQDWLRSFGE
tara:strand:+ start:227 stop:553 length:327 start_codon:yes stop_codon:yes gene_type:complete